ncbi:MAG: tRNA (guanosine(46)-N7)-methyltransferase TrmB [Pedosphaera sp.]|nr:tRNA (guanosine(46)-N7)-methyltransferase TrmB [Pedosphaera sp.]
MTEEQINDQRSALGCPSGVESVRPSTESDPQACIPADPGAPTRPELRSPAATLIYRPVTYVERLNLRQLFSSQRPLEVELGSGDGSFLAQYARLNPDLNFLAVERLLGRLRKLDRKGLRAGLTNLRLIRIEASYFAEYLLPRESVRALHIYFPDPWPKRRHHKNRLIHTLFTEVTRQVLEPNGKVYLRTDNADYFAQMTDVFQSNSAFRIIDTPSPLSGIKTDFERDFEAKGVPTLRAAYQRAEG